MTTCLTHHPARKSEVTSPIYGYGLLACFGMGGWETLIWNHIVRTRYAEWINCPSFIVGQFDLKGLPTTALSFHFIDKIKMDILPTQNWRIKNMAASIA